MSHIIVIRSYKPGDETNCRTVIKEGVMSPMRTTFLGNCFREVTFELMILLGAILFIFFGVPFTVCLLAIPVMILLTYIITYTGFTAKSMEVDQEIINIPRVYMSNAFSGFWVAEAFEPHLMTRLPKDIHYTVMTEKTFRESNIDVSSQAKRIVGTIAVGKSKSLDRGAWIKRLTVHQHYRRKGIGSCLLNAAVQFAIDQGYSCANTVASEYTEGGRELCLKKGFELKQMYHKAIIGPLVSILMYELTYQIKPDEDNLVPYLYKKLLSQD